MVLIIPPIEVFIQLKNFNRWPVMTNEIKLLLNNPSDIVCIEFSNGIVHFSMKDGSRKSFEILFSKVKLWLSPKRFLQINSNVFINMHYLKGRKHGSPTWKVRLEHDLVFNISEPYKMEFMRLLSKMLRLQDSRLKYLAYRFNKAKTSKWDKYVCKSIELEY